MRLVVSGGVVLALLVLGLISYHRVLGDAPMQAPKLVAMPTAAPAYSRRRVDSHYYVLSVATLPLPAKTERGALALWGDAIVVADRFGALYQVDGRAGQVMRLPFAVPVRLSQSALERFEQKTLSVLDIEIIGSDREATLYASYLDHEPERNCLRVALAALAIARDGGSGAAIESRGDWRVVHRTRPCIDVRALDSAGLFGTGGRIKPLGRDLLLTVGSLALDGLDDAPMVSQEPDSDYGKILRIDPTRGTAEIFSRGHRNPQGLAILSDGRILSSEHGPRGGDELNIIVAGTNYGWPRVTFGTRVYFRDWPPGKRLGRHDGYQQPLFAFMPSVGPSELVEIRDSRQFPLWNGDLVLATLVAQRLIRLHLDGARVVYVEAIDIGHRLRDLAAQTDGSLVALTDDDRLLIIGNDAAATGTKIGQ